MCERTGPAVEGDSWKQVARGPCGQHQRAGPTGKAIVQTEAASMRGEGAGGGETLPAA